MARREELLDGADWEVVTMRKLEGMDAAGAARTVVRVERRSGRRREVGENMVGVGGVG